MTDAKYKLISFYTCPFVQRSVITLNEKGVDFDIEFVDLANKPDWFLALSPLGKVPVLQVGDTVLFESAVINEYLDEVTEGRMLPEEPLKRAFGRAWIEFGSQMLFDIYKMQIAKDAEAFQAALEGTRKKLARLERELPSDGPYFYGADLSLVDTAIAPGLMRLGWMMDIDEGLDVYEDLPKVRRWAEALLARDSVKRSTVENILEHFHGALRKNEAHLASMLPAA